MSNTRTRKPVGKPAPATATPTGPGSDDEFVYDSPAGTITIPSLATIKAGVIRRARKLDPAGQMFTLIEEVCDEATLEVVDELRASELNDFMTAWVEHSGVSLGE